MLSQTKRNAVVILSIISLSLPLALSVASASDQEEYKPAVIHFADLGGIKDWRAEGINAMLIEGINGQWYRATFFNECFEMPWAEKVAFVTEPDGSLNQFSSVIVGGRQCYFKKIEKTADPGMKSKENR